MQNTSDSTATSTTRSVTSVSVSVPTSVPELPWPGSRRESPFTCSLSDCPVFASSTNPSGSCRSICGDGGRFRSRGSTLLGRHQPRTLRSSEDNELRVASGLSLWVPETRFGVPTCWFSQSADPGVTLIRNSSCPASGDSAVRPWQHWPRDQQDHLSSRNANRLAQGPSQS